MALNKYSQVRCVFLETIGEYESGENDTVIGFDAKTERYAIVPFCWREILKEGGFPRLVNQYRENELRVMPNAKS